MKSRFRSCALVLLFMPAVVLAVTPERDIPIAQWSAPPTWRPDPATAGKPGSKAGRTPLVVLTGELPFYAITPCRVADTRGNGFVSPYGTPKLVAATVRSYPITGQCSIPVGARAVSFNFTVVNAVGQGFLTAYQQGGAFPPVSTLNYNINQTINNAAVVPLGTSLTDSGLDLGGLSVAAGVSDVDLIIDVNGYYAPGAWTTSGGLTSTVNSVSIGGNLTVTGSITGNPINAKYLQDVAEWVPVREVLAPGTVVVIDVTRKNGVSPSRVEYDTRVAGVVSDAPGVILGEAGENKAMIATTGRVRVRVSAVQPIRVGDLLVTSSTAGAAMKSIPMPVGSGSLHRPGTLIGKALESLEEGEGEILVLLSLQ